MYEQYNFAFKHKDVHENYNYYSIIIPSCSEKYDISESQYLSVEKTLEILSKRFNVPVDVIKD